MMILFSNLEHQQRQRGHWRLVSTNVDGKTTIYTNQDILEYYQFEGTKEEKSEMTDNHNGKFTIPTSQPFCELKEKNNKKFIEYINLSESWELEIVKIFKDELVLTDLKTSCAYVRKLIKD